MEFVDGSRGVYRPIRVLFDAPMYKRALQICWHVQSYKTMIVLVTELLKLQQRKKIPAEATVEDMTDLLLEKSKATLRVQLWEFELEEFDDREVKSLLTLVWEVNNKMKMRDIEFEARRLHMYPQDMPDYFHRPEFSSLAQEYGWNVTDQLKVARTSKLLSPKEVVLEVVPKVLQRLWVPPRSTFLNMPSQRISEMTVGVTKAVLDRVSAALSTSRQAAFSRSIRDDMVLSVQEKVRQMYPDDAVRRRKLNSFEAQVLSAIADAAAMEVCALFQPRTDTLVPDVVDGAEAVHAQDQDLKPGPKDNRESVRGTDPAADEPANNIGLVETVESASTSSQKSDAAVVPAQPSSDEAPTINGVQEDSAVSQTEPDEAPESTEQTPPPLPFIPGVFTLVLNGEDVSKETNREPDSVVTPAPPSSATTADGPPAITAGQDIFTTIMIEPAEEPATEPDSCPTPPLTPASEPSFTTSGLDSDDMSEETSTEPDSVTAPASPANEPPALTAVQEGSEVKMESGRFASWFRKTLCSTFLRCFRMQSETLTL